MSKTLVVNPAPAPVVKPVAYYNTSNGCVYIPRSKEEGGGIYHGNTGEFIRNNYGDIGEKVWNDFEPLYAGTTITITKEITL